MKELSIEEKAKRYDEILEGAKYYYESLDSNTIDCVFEELIPELKENDDEQIRKYLIDVVNDYCKGREHDGCIAWLEKQGEHKHLELKVGKWYICYRAYCCRADHLTVKEGERILCEKDGVVKGFVVKDAEKYFKECNAPAPYEDEQKPKWSEEDEDSNVNDETNAPTEYGKYVDECLNEASKHFFSEREDKYSVADLFYAGVRCGKSWLEKQGEKNLNTTIPKFKEGETIIHKDLGGEFGMLKNGLNHLKKD